ncbi:ERF family protein [Allohahella sp. A8]|uniref:ERF family protein n=1 Tax=Allohahella sp. A8 TaxID=3141461 RepID=UPI003A7FD09A
MSNVTKSESLKELASALAKAQAEIGNAAKNSKNPHFKSSYADLAEILNTTRPVLSKHGLSVVQMPGYGEQLVTLTTLLMHSSGEYIESECCTPIAKHDAQQVGSALTYLRRYSLAAVCGIAQEDDDGNAATAAAPRQQAQKAAQAQSKPALKPGTKAWGNAIAAYKRDGNLVAVLEHMEISPEVRRMIMEEANSEPAQAGAA